MSNYEWERGEFKLPSAEFASFRQEIQAVDRAHKEKVFNLTQECWKGLTRKQQTDPDAYRQAIFEFVDKKRRSGSSRYYDERNADEAAFEDAQWALERKISSRWDPAAGRSMAVGRPSRVLQSEMDYPTNRTTTFHGTGCSVRFDKDTKTVVWEVDENNHAVDHARASSLGKAFFARLDKVRWTHGTGGAIYGNNEYNREDRYDGGGNYCSGAYGYLGIEQEPVNSRPFTNAKGERIEVQIKQGRYGFVGKAVKAGGGQRRVSRGVPSGGQFAARGRGESGIRL